MQGARGYWIASTTGLTLAALALCAFLVFVMRRQKAAQRATQLKPAG